MTQDNFTPDQAITYLKFRFGKSYSNSYLAKCRCTGEGPVYYKIGSSVFYDQVDLDNWILSRRTSKAKSSADMAIQEGLNVKIVDTEPLYPDFDDGYVSMD